MPQQPDNSDANLHERLVAYLDGELTAEESRRIEELLASDADVRRDLQSLDRSWELLDRLDTSEVPEEFVNSTLEMVAVAASGDLPQQRASAAIRRRLGRALIAAGLLAAGLAGFFAVDTFTSAPNRRLIRDLPVLENLETYRQVDDVEFLHMLRDEGLFVEEDSNG